MAKKKLTSAKAKKILHDKSVHGHPLTDKQRKFFGAIANAQMGTMVTPLDFSKSLGTLEGVSDVMSAPARTATYLVTGKYQDPSEAIGIKNPVGAFVTDMVLDPVNLIGAGLAGKAAKASTKTGMLRNAYKINPFANKGNVGYTDLMRIQEKNAVPLSQLARENKLFPSWLNSEENARKFAERETHFGEWFTKDKSDLDWYRTDREFRNPEIINLKVPNSVLDKYSVANIPSANKLSRAADREFVIPKSEQINFQPHWLKGYKEIKPSKKKQDGGWLDKYEQGGMVLKQKKQDNYGTKPNANNSDVSLPPNFKGLAYNTKGRNYSPAWGGQFQMGGVLPGAVGFTYARTQGAAPSNGPYAKKTKASAQNGMEMKYYQEGLDFTPKTISQDGAVIDADGYWNPDNWGNPVIIPSTDITMEGVYQPLIGISDTGDVQYMEPGENYEFDGEYVTEYPVAQDGRKVKTLPTVNIKAPTLYVDNPNDPRLKSYQDSLRLYNAYQMQDKLMGPKSEISKDKHKWTTAELKEGRKKRIVEGLEEHGPLSSDYQSEKDQFAEGYNDLSARKQDRQLIRYYKSLGFTDKDIMYHSSPDIVSDKIKAIGTYFDGTAYSPVYKKPVRPVVYKKPEPKPIAITPTPPLEPVRKPSIPTPPAEPKYKMRGDSPIYGPSGSLIGMIDRKTKEFYPDYLNEAARAKVNKTDTDILSDSSALSDYFKSMGQNDVRIVPKKKSGGNINQLDEYPIEKLDNLLNFTNYNKAAKGGWLDKYQ